MFYYLVATAAVIFTSLMVASIFYGEFPFLNYRKDSIQFICRMLFLFCNILLIAAAVYYPEKMFCSYFSEAFFGEAVGYDGYFISLLSVLIMLLAEFAYWMINIVVLMFIAWIWFLILKAVGWIIYEDKEYFFD